MKLTENFYLAEFACHDGTPVPKKYLENVTLLAMQLQVLRDYIKEPVRLNSGFRTPAHNARIGGAPGSQHLYAKAADIATEGYTPKQLAKVVEKLIKEKKLWFGGIGIYNSWIHVDTRLNRARW